MFDLILEWYNIKLGWYYFGKAFGILWPYAAIFGIAIACLVEYIKEHLPRE